LKELTRVVKPGGEIILLGWTSQQVLPGYPLLEARLNATCSAYLPYLKDKRPDTHFMSALQAFQRAGLMDVVANTFVGTMQSPLSDVCKTAIASLFAMLWGTPQPEVSQRDWQEQQRLCKPESPDFILNLPEYYGFYTYSVFRGEVDKTTFHTKHEFTS
jgi:demethylmenaquinone methyltransferase/2-methoxy-6-polyprenyl-1,4-benzoquinol methylase